MSRPAGTSGELESALAELQALLERQRLPAARKVLATALPKFPDSPALLEYSACIDWMEDRLDPAAATVGQVLALEPESRSARLLLCRIRMEQERYAEAEELVIDLLRNDPDDPDLYARYAQIMVRTFNVEKAERLAAEALRRDPEHEEALNLHVLCGFIAHPDKEQRARLRQLLEEHPDQTATAIRLVQRLVVEGKTRQAYGLAGELVRRHPDNDAIVEMAAALRHQSHWSMLPLWPMQKWGWAASIGIWLVVVVLIRTDILADTPLAGWQGGLALAFIAYVVYSWAWPPLLRRLLR